MGVGEHVRQRAQPHPEMAGDREAPGGQQRADLTHRPGDGDPVDPVELREHGMRQLETQHNQGDQQPIEEHQRVVGAGTGRAPAVATAAFA
nr:hypothetical protein [Frankia sp. Cppng1_Ct_nod]